MYYFLTVNNYVSVKRRIKSLLDECFSLSLEVYVAVRDLVV